MFFRKTERRKHSVVAILAVGALATVGAVTVGKYAKRAANDMICKIKTVFKSEECACPVEKEC